MEDITIDGSKHCTSSDISEDGLYVSTIQMFEKDSLVDIAIPLKGEKLMVKGEIKHCQPGIGFGIRFIGLSARQKEEIKSLIASLSERRS